MARGTVRGRGKSPSVACHRVKKVLTPAPWGHRTGTTRGSERSPAQGMGPQGEWTGRAPRGVPRAGGAGRAGCGPTPFPPPPLA